MPWLRVCSIFKAANARARIQLCKDHDYCRVCTQSHGSTHVDGICPPALNAPFALPPPEKHTHYSPVLNLSNSRENNPLQHHLPGEEVLEEGLEDVAVEVGGVGEEVTLHHEAAMDLDTLKHQHLDSSSDLDFLNLTITKSIQLNLGKICFCT